MALIKCPECGNEISDTAEQCIHCGYKLKKGSKKDDYVFIKLPTFFEIKSTFKQANNKCVIKSENNELWSGYSGETAKINIESDTNIDIYVSDVYETKYILYSLLFYIFSIIFDIVGIIMFFNTLFTDGNIFISIIFIFLGFAGLIGGIYFSKLMKSKTRTVKIISQKVVSGSRYEVIAVENNNNLAYDISKIKYRLREIDVIVQQIRF